LKIHVLLELKLICYMCYRHGESLNVKVRLYST
jgi:hypothetical protein